MTARNIKVFKNLKGPISKMYIILACSIWMIVIFI